jgi:hypothetical protein
MLLTVLVLSGTILAATTIAGILMVYQIRQSTSSSDSAKAVFAADAGIEWALYNSFKDPDLPAPIFTNGASVEVVSEPGVSIKSTGSAGQVSRAFQITF